MEVRVSHIQTTHELAFVSSFVYLFSLRYQGICLFRPGTEPVPRAGCDGIT